MVTVFAARVRYAFFFLMQPPSWGEPFLYDVLSLNLNIAISFMFHCSYSQSHYFSHFFLLSGRGIREPTKHPLRFAVRLHPPWNGSIYKKMISWLSTRGWWSGGPERRSQIWEWSAALFSNAERERKLRNIFRETARIFTSLRSRSLFEEF